MGFLASLNDLRLPLIVAPMFLISGPEMVLAACRANVIGSFPGTNARTIEDLDRWFALIVGELKTLSADPQPTRPWAFSIVTHSTYRRFEQELDLVAKHMPPIVITALGGPERVVDVVARYGGRVFADVATIEHARRAVDRGADGLILIGAGAGGHTGRYSLFAFIEEIRRFWHGPVAAGGAISSGAGILAAQTLGADVALIGTLFIPARESMAAEEYKSMVAKAGLQDIVASDALTGALANWLQPSLSKMNVSPRGTGGAAPNFSSPFVEVRAWRDIWSAGHGVGAAGQDEPLGTIVSRLHEEYAASLRARGP